MKQEACKNTGTRAPHGETHGRESERARDAVDVAVGHCRGADEASDVKHDHLLPPPVLRQR